MMPAPKRKPPRERVDPLVVEADRPAPFQFAAIDALILALVLGFAMLLIERTGFANGEELWPSPDAIEYAAMAANLDRGMGPVLHFADHTYPARYTIGYSLLLAMAYPLVGHRPERLCLVTALTALVAIAALYLLTLWAFDRQSAMVAALLLSLSPYFLGLSTCLLTDVPSLAICLLAALAFLYAEERASLLASVLCGLLIGWSVTIRATNGAIVGGILAAVMLMSPRRLDVRQLIAFALGLIPFPALQAWSNWHYLGSPLANGYTFWRPDLYGRHFDALGLRYLFVPGSPTEKIGNLLAYGPALLGVDGFFGPLRLGMELRTLLHARYSLYPFPVVIFAGLGTRTVLRGKRDAFTMRTIYLCSGFLAGLLSLYLFYFYHDPRFVLPGLFIVFALAGYGMVSANQNLKWGWIGAGIVALDAVVVAALIAETISRFSMGAPDSKIVAEVRELQPRMAHSVVVSDISLQWLELFAGGEGIEFVGLDDLLAQEAINEYHLHFLYQKKAAGILSTITLPPVLLPDGKLDSAEARALSDEDKAGRPVYLLVAMPMRADWASTLMGEFGELDRAFTMETVARYPEIGLYRLQPR